MKSLRIFLSLFAIVLVATLTLPKVFASHSWGGYHWARTANPFTLKLGDNVTSTWKPYLAETSTDWSASSVLNTAIVTGNGGKNCKATAGRIEVCNRKYGNNGWLGIAQIWISGPHITQGVTKMNDTYFNTPTYNTPAWKNLVMCQEVGHILGLDHQDENFDNQNLNTCMDYTSSPDSNQHPNAHDYEEIESIYAHLDSTTTVGQTVTGSNHMPEWVAEGTFENAKEWGKELKNNGRAGLYERDFGGGNKLFTFVIFAQ